MLKKDSKLIFDDIYLRYFQEEDIEKFINWNVNEHDWQKWDAPWEDNQRTENQLREFLVKVLKRPAKTIPGRLQIIHSDGNYIGAVSTYLIDGDEYKRAIGINVYDTAYIGKGLGKQALKLWIGYLFEFSGLDSLYCETWSGNTRMVNLAVKLGFKEIRRVIDKRTVRGAKYDALRFKLNKEDFISQNPYLLNDIKKQISES